jgi:hypothetical protein
MRSRVGDLKVKVKVKGKLHRFNSLRILPALDIVPFLLLHISILMYLYL